MLAPWLWARQNYRIVATLVVLAGLVVTIVGMQQPPGSKLVTFGAAIEIAGLVFLIAARRKAA